jgi:ABC-type transporter Mla MlaB component
VIYQTEGMPRVGNSRSPGDGCDEFSALEPSVLQMPTPGSHEVAFAIRGPIGRADLPGLCERICALLTAGRAEIACCHVTGVGVDAVTIDALARLQLAARRQGCRVVLRGASPRLRELVAFMGLSHVLPEENLAGVPLSRDTRAEGRTAGKASPRRGRR